MQVTVKKRAFTIVELMVVISVIAILSALLITAVTRSLGAAKTAEAQNRMREIHTMMQTWSGGNNGRVLPSQFNFSDEAAAGTPIHVRSDEHLEDDRYTGTWTDILWVENEMHETYGLHESEEEERDHLRWKSDSPGADIYAVRKLFDNPFRSTMPNTRNASGRLPLPRPYGDGAREIDLQGYFAANDFFDARSDADGHPDADDGQNAEPSKVDRYYTYGMLDAPAKSLYLVDSVAGETIAHKTISGDDDESAWLYDFGKGTISLSDSTGMNSDPTGEIDYRYGSQEGSCLILMLDGHVAQEVPWTRLGLDNPMSGGGPDRTTLQGRGIRVGNLTKKVRSQ
ncbi:MAG: type II secretion system protein [Phycisphaerales bacterium]|jgi:prepilin-type N-terminal cleavage/methylation domain-containing protein|nr:type II secretion system protein [Phycisphaerales bacterium]